MDPISKQNVNPSGEYLLTPNTETPKPPSPSAPRMIQSTQSVIPYATPHEPLPPVGDDSAFEEVLRVQFEQLGPHESIELSGNGAIKAELALDFKGKLRAERRPDGRFTVEVEGQGEAGIGAPVVGVARLGIAAGTTFHVSTAAQAADLCDALVKGAVVTAAGAVFPGLSNVFDSAHRLGLKGDMVDARSRVVSYLPQVSEAKIDLTGYGQLGDTLAVNAGGFDFRAISAEASVQPRHGLSVDFEKGELRLNSSMTLAGDAFLKVPLALNVSENGKLTVTGSVVMKLPADMISSLKEGRLSAVQAWESLAVGNLADQIILKAEFDVAGNNLSLGAEGFNVKLKGESILDFAQFNRPLDAEQFRYLLREMKFSLESEAAVGSGAGFDVSLGKAEVSVWRKRKSHWGGAYSAGEAITKAHQLMESGSSLDVRRATAALQ